MKKSEIQNTIDELKAAAAAGAAINPELCEKIAGAILAGITYKHDGKMRYIISISTNCGLCPYCKIRAKNEKCTCNKCYAGGLLRMRKGLKDKTTRNTYLLTSAILPRAAIPFINACVFRFESFGDLINEIQVVNYFNIAKYNPGCHFTLWTKNAFLIRRAFEHYGIKKPRNLTIIFSSPFLNTPALTYLNKYDWIDKIFTVYELKYLQAAGMSLKEIDNFINCGSKNCAGCMKCYGGKCKIQIINEMAKSDQKRFDNMLKKAGLK